MSLAKFYRGLTNEELVERVRADNDELALNILCERLTQFARNLCKSHPFRSWDEVDDFLSDELIRFPTIIQNYKQGKGTAFTSYAWLCIQCDIANYFRKASAKHRSIDRTAVSLESLEEAYHSPNGHKKEKILWREIEERNAIDDVEERALQDSMIEEILARLSPFQKAVFDLYFRSEYSIREMTKQLGCTRKALTRALHQILAIAEGVKEKYYGEDR